jgi:hypothetical protein
VTRKETALQRDAGTGDPGAPKGDGGAIYGTYRPPRPSCVPEGGADVPDDAFADTNCDGIDGDVLAAVFVSPGGSDEANGEVGAPVKTLTRAIARATEQGKTAVYACVGVYAENVVLTAGIDLYGGFDCERGWERVRDVARVRPPEGVPLTIRDVTAPVRIQRMAFQASNVEAPGGSSIAVVITRSEDVRFEQAELVSGHGGKGVEGTNPPRVWEPVPKARRGEDIEVTVDCLAKIGCTGWNENSPPVCEATPRGGDGQPITCPDGAVVKGGPGGRGGNCSLGLYGVPGSAGTSVASPGTRGRAGRAGAAFGSIVDGAYVPSVGVPGGWGEPGSGGRGGDGSSGTNNAGDNFTHYTIGGAGGQGGYPGCGGDGGNGGGGGGASIALLMDAGGVRLASTFLITGQGGDGGLPALGVAGQSGGDGARGSEATGLVTGGAGTRGGDGGRGGAGGPGAGGPSVGIVHVGQAPEMEDTQFELGEPGLGATGASQAPDGLGANVHEVRTWSTAK